MHTTITLASSALSFEPHVSFLRISRCPLRSAYAQSVESHSLQWYFVVSVMVSEVVRVRRLYYRSSIFSRFRFMSSVASSSGDSSHSASGLSSPSSTLLRRVPLRRRFAASVLAEYR